MAPKVLVVLTSADKIVKLDKPTGWYLVRTQNATYCFNLNLLS